MSTDLSSMVDEEDTPFGVLERLKRVFIGCTRLTLVQLLRSVLTRQYQPDQDLLQHIHKLKEGFVKIMNLGLAFDDDIKAYMLLMTMGNAFESVLQPFLLQTLADPQGNKQKLDFSEVCGVLEAAFIQQEREKALRIETEVDAALTAQRKAATGNKFKTQGKTVRCTHCSGKNHVLTDCWFYKAKVARGWSNPPPCRSFADRRNDDRDPTRKRKDDDGTQKGARMAKKPRTDSKGQEQGMLALDDDEDSDMEHDEEHGEQVYMAVDGSHYCAQVHDWILDTGATRHMSPHRKLFTSYTPTRRIIEVGGGKTILATGIGTITGFMDGKHRLVLTGVYHVPELQFNLFSISKQMAKQQSTLR